jgi:hypothetical protein
VLECLFSANEVYRVGGHTVGFVDGGVRTLSDCVFLGNRGLNEGMGAGVSSQGGRIILERNTFWDSSHTWPYPGSGVVLFLGATWNNYLANNIIANTSGGPAIELYSVTLTSECNVLWQNEDGIGNGYEPGPTDQIVDPLFCDPEAGDLTLRPSRHAYLRTRATAARSARSASAAGRSRSRV